jgi:hypothetical protein
MSLTLGFKKSFKSGVWVNATDSEHFAQKLNMFGGINDVMGLDGDFHGNNIRRSFGLSN